MKKNRKTEPLNQRSKNGLHWLRNVLPLTKLDWILILLVFIVALVGALFGEKITVNDGRGWDGQLYATVARDFSLRHMSGMNVDSYYIQRILPSAVVHYTLRLLGVPLTTPHIILGFALLDVAMLTLSALAWCLICNHLGLSSNGKLLGFMAVFGGFGLTKYMSFYPVLTDYAGFFLSIWMLYFYLARRRLPLLLLTIAGAFSWPTLLYEGMLFLLFPREEKQAQSELEPAPHYFNLWAALGTSLVLMTALLWVTIFYKPIYSMRPYPSLVSVSILVTVLYWFYGLAYLLDARQYFSPRYWFRQIRPLTWIIVLLCAFGIKFIQGRITVPGHIPLGTTLEKILLMPISAPGKSLVAHFFFFGPLVLLILFWWKPMARYIRELGSGMMLNVFLGLFFLLASESRAAINYLPLFILPLAQVAGSFRWRPWQLGFAGILTAVFTRVWVPLNGDTSLVARGFSRLFPQEPILIEPIFPNTFFWSSSGPWTTFSMYRIEAVTTVVVGCLIYFFMIRAGKASSVQTGTIEDENEPKN